MQHGLNNTDIQKANRSLVIKIMLSKGLVSRVDLVRETKLRKATITNIINEFLELGIVQEEGYSKADAGRRTDAFRLKVPQLVIVSIRFTRKFYHINLYDLMGMVLEEKKGTVLVDQDVNELMQNVMQETDHLLSRYDRDNILGMCIALPGPYIRRNNHNIAKVTGFTNLSKVDVEKTFDEHYNFKVLTEHDAKLAAFAEWKQIEPQEDLLENNLVQIQSIGMGVGSGAVINARILKGSVGVAGEIGHMGVNFNGPMNDHDNRGAFEYYAGTEACIRYLKEMMYQYPGSRLQENSKYKEIVLAYYDGDELATKVAHKLAWMVGYGIASLAFVLNPNTVIIGDDYPQSDDFLHTVRQTVEQLVYPEMYETMNIQYSIVNQDTTLLGGYYYVLERYLNNNQIIDKIRKAVVC